jgi:lysozyme family protein
MAEFSKAIDFVLSNEGGYEPANSTDPGGETNFGISKREYQWLDIKNLTRPEAITIYERDYWKFDGIENQRIATKIFDAYVNMAPHECIRLVQLALGAIQAGPIVADGRLGSETVGHINSVDETRFLDELKFQLVRFYYEDAQANPSVTADLHGWWRRAVKG